MTKLEVIGNLGADAEIRSGEGYKFVSFRVADTQKWTDQDGKEHEQTDWYDCVFNNVESKVIPYLVRGTKVYVRGNARPKLYSSMQERKMKATISLNVMEIELLSGKADPVPRELIIPDTMEIVKVQKYYQAEIDTSKFNNNDFALLTDKNGLLYKVVKGGWVAPHVEQEQGDSQSQEGQENK